MPPGFALNGSVSGAGKIVQNATVSVYRVGTTGYGSAATLLGSATTNGAGNWTVAFDQPTDDPLIYVLVDGGTVGQGANNALSLMAGVGPINAAPAAIPVNEVTTVAAVYALAQFLDTPTRNVGAPATNTVGLVNAFTTIANLVDAQGKAYVTANPFVGMVIPGTGASAAPPGKTVNTLANAIAACVDSNGRASTPCATLLTTTVAAGTPAPSDTRAALLSIARHPADFVQPLVALSHSDGTPNRPDFGTDQPNDFTLGISYVGGALLNTEPHSIAIDRFGSVWMTTTLCDGQVTNSGGCILELQPGGTRAGVFPPAPDVLPNVPDFGGPRPGGAIAIATDPATGRQTVFASSNRGSYVIALNALTATELAGSRTNAGGHIVRPEAIAADGSGTLWVTNAVPTPQLDGTLTLGFTQLTAGPQNDFSVSQTYDIRTPGGALGITNAEITGIAVEPAAGIGGGGGPTGVWLTDGFNDRVLRLATPGQLGAQLEFLSPAMNGPLALDAGGNVWIANSAASNGIIEIVNGANRPVRTFTANPVNRAGGMAIDGAGHIWISNVGMSSDKGVIEVLPDGSAVANTTDAGEFLGGYPRVSGGPLGPLDVAVSPAGIAIDPSGNVWVAGGESLTLMQIVGAAAPVPPPTH
jgi:hypothetical protein